MRDGINYGLRWDDKNSGEGDGEKEAGEKAVSDGEREGVRWELEERRKTRENKTFVKGGYKFYLKGKVLV